MIKVICSISDNDIYEYCTWEGLIKPQWEHIINAIYRAGGNARYNICPICKGKTLIFSYDRGENSD